MAATKYEVASTALVLIGAEPVSSFGNAEDSTAEQIICYHVYQSTLDQWLSLYPWRFATKTVQLSRVVDAPNVTEYSAAYTEPTGQKAIWNVTDAHGNPQEYDRMDGQIRINWPADQNLYCEHTYEPAVSTWPGYFTALIETALANRFAFGLAGKIDLKKDVAGDVETFFRLAKNADARQQTAKKLPLRGRGTLIEGRRT